MTTAAPQPMLRLLGMLPAATRVEMVRMYGETLRGPLQDVGDALRAPSILRWWPWCTRSRGRQP
jgi:hypothetical protein